MPIKLKYENVKLAIDKDDKLLSKEYISNKSLLDIQCGRCDLNYTQTYERYQRGFRHKNCKNKIIKFNKKNNKNATTKILIKDLIRKCIWCNKEYNVKRREQQYCNKICANKKLNSNSELNKERGRIGGNKSLQMFSRRSKAEIDFANLCIDHFGSNNIICNKLFFKDKNNNYWDADIIITHLKIAILYNGVFHYKRVYKDQKLERMIAKDKLKQQIIIQNGYTYYIVKDLKSYNKKFVVEQFNLFIHKLNYNLVLHQLIVNNHKILYNNVLDSIYKLQI